MSAEVHAKGLQLAAAIKRAQRLQSEQEICQSQIRTLSAELQAAIEQEQREAVTARVRPYVQNAPAVQAEENRRANNGVTYGFTPLADRLTKEHLVVLDCHEQGCRELYSHWHTADGGVVAK